MNKSWQISRRHLLRGLGASIALPSMEAMLPAGRALAAAASGSASPFPVRLGYFFVPNGVHMPDWKPERTGGYFDLPYILEPLGAVKNDLLVLSGLTHDKGRANGDGPGDHARSAGVFLTGAQPLKSEGSEIRAGVSVDQVAARVLGSGTRFPSLELGTEGGRPYGKCDSGYSCAYSNNVSWKDENSPIAKQTNPREVFERLFANELKGEIDESQARRRRYKKSILDFVLEDARNLSGRLGETDRMKLDEYLTSIREIEKRLEHTEKPQTRAADAAASYGQRPEGIPESYEEHLRLMGDMMVLAFQADVTRVSTFMFANAGSNRSYGTIGVNEGHHQLSHHQGDPRKHAKIREINRFHVTQLSYILQRMRSIPEGDGTLLDNSLIVYGSGISDGNRHNNENLPVVLAGKAGGAISTGRHVEFPRETPMCNLLLSTLRCAGAGETRFGDSTGELRQLKV